MAWLPRSARAKSNVVDFMPSGPKTRVKGANNPKVRARIELGKSEHKRIQADSGKCTVSEITIDSYRMDCVYVSGGTCTIVEIKPDNSAAKSKGREKLDDYKDAVEDLFKNKKEDGFKSGKLTVFQKCIKDGRLSLKIALRVYNVCPSNFKVGEDWIE